MKPRKANYLKGIEGDTTSDPEKGDLGKEIENEKILQKNDILDSD